ncbi:MAG TPA: rhamnan synthesis F family protein [Prolixibacteraceae bacterium]
MKRVKKSLCIYIHYSQYSHIPKYVSIYVDELSKYFDQVVLVTNQRILATDFINANQNVSTLFVKNEGYDLGMFYKAFQTIDPEEYDQIACINDSNILINELHPVFDWSKKTSCDFWGIIDSDEKPWFSTHQDNYHIQSHFIVFNQKAIEKLPAFFEALHIQNIFEEKDTVKLRHTVINDWEIGLTQFLIKEGLKSASYIDSRSYSLLYLSGKQTNVGHKLYAELIRSGYPLIKKKVITKSNWKDTFRPSGNWEKLIRQFGNQNWEIEALIDELNEIKRKSGNQSLIKIKKKFWKTYNSLTKK